MEAYLLVAVAVVMGLLAAGAVLFIKIARRRQATRTGTLEGTVPANPLSAQDARRMTRRYALVAVLIIGATAAATTWVATAA